MRWAKTNSGKSNPLDVEPSPDGNVAIVTTAGVAAEPVEFAVTLSGAALVEARTLGVDLRTSHFATCPDRDEWKGRRTR